MAVKSPQASPNANSKEDGNTGNGDLRRGRSPERRDNKGEKGSSQSKSPTRAGKNNILPSNDTNSTDPESVRCRVFVGNLNTDKIGQEELVKYFSEFGKINGCSLHANFGFVQYATREDADRAVAKTHGTFIFGKRVDVNIASERRKPQSKDKRKENEGANRSRRRSRSSSRSSERYRSRSPMSRYDELYRRDDPFGRNDRQYPREYYEDKRSDHFYNPEPVARPRDSYEKDLYTEGSSKTAGCEVIAMSGDLKNYAESIQSRLHAMGINTNVMFPPPDVSVLRIVDNISRSGSLYAVVITSQNFYHKSCTLNVLHGAPQEHRNMPLDDALAFVARNFNQYLNDSKDRRAVPLQGAPLPKNRGDAMGKTILTQDPYISGLLTMAAGGKALKVVEVNHLIEALIKYKNEIDSNSDKDIAALVVDKSVPLPPAASSTLHPDQQHHTGLPASLLQEALPPHASESQNYYSSQLSSATFKHASSTSYSRSDYPDYEASPNAGLGPSASYAGAVGQQSTSYPASSYSQKMSSFPNYYN